MSESAQEESPSFDVLLMSAVSSEFDALKVAARTLNLGWKKHRSRVVREYRELDGIQGERIAAFQLRAMGSFSASGSAFTCYRALRETRANSIIAIGIAFGVDEGVQQIGDILISKRVLLYDEGTVRDASTPGNYVYAYGEGAILPATERLVTLFERGQLSAGERPVQVGTFLAGGARIESGAFRSHLCDRVQPVASDVVGGEMESPGVASACAAVPSTGWVVVKAISDFATAESRKSIDVSRGVAAAKAAEFVLRILSRPPSRATIPP